MQQNFLLFIKNNKTIIIVNRLIIQYSVDFALVLKLMERIGRLWPVTRYTRERRRKMSNHLQSQGGICRSE